MAGNKEHTTQFTLFLGSERRLRRSVGRRFPAILRHERSRGVRLYPIRPLQRCKGEINNKTSVGGVGSELLQNPSTSWDPFVLLNESEIEVRFALSLVRV